MSTTKISDLPVLSTADAADEFVVVDDSAGVTKKITQAGLSDFGSNTLTAGGITFGSDTLDDYEEGTFTPSYVSDNGTLVISGYGERSGFYTKINNRVFVQGWIRGGYSSGSGNLRLAGLPFPNKSGGNGDRSVLFFGHVGSWDDDHPISGIMLAGAATARIFGRQTADAQDFNLTTSDMGTDSGDNYIQFTGQYLTD